MLTMIPPIVAIGLAAIIFGRAICVVYNAHPSKHRHPLLFIGFGYSYVTLGAGAIFAAIDVCGGNTGDVALWLILIGSAGLIAFDRRRQQCWAVTHCPAEMAETEKRGGR